MKNVVKIVLVILALFPVIVNAEITLTEDLLEQGIKSLTEDLKNNSEEQDYSDNIITLDKTNKQLIITTDDETLKSYYKINDNNTITFTTSGRFYKGMTYEEYKNADIIHFHMFHNTKLSLISLLQICTEKNKFLACKRSAANISWLQQLREKQKGEKIWPNLKLYY